VRLLVVRVLADGRVGVRRLARGSRERDHGVAVLAGVVAELLLPELAFSQRV
jgi:hypothetical protein